MVYLKIPTGKNANEDTTYIHIHGKNSVVHKQFTMIVNDSTKYPICVGSMEKVRTVLIRSIDVYINLKCLINKLINI